MGDSKKGVLISAAMFYLVLVMQVQQSRGDDDDTAKAIDKTFCYGECLAPCVKKSGWVGKALCATKCTVECGFSAESAALHSTNNIPNPRDNLYFCNIGCASSLCTNFVTKQNPGACIYAQININFSSVRTAIIDLFDHWNQVRLEI